MEEYNVVKVIELLSLDRHYDGTEGVKRSPQIGDVGAIVHVNATNESYIVECVNADGYTVWLADFLYKELEFVSEGKKLLGRIENSALDLSTVADEAKAAFGSVSVEQLNWKPSEKSWSIAQCFDHLITTHSLYFPESERLASGKVKMSFWEKTSPFSGFFGRFLIKGLDPKNLKPMKTTAKAFPSESEIGGDIIERFSEHQQQMIDAINKLPTDIDPTKTFITSPLLGIVTYSLADCFTVLVVHCQRHFNQAQRVTESEGFPMSEPGAIATG